MSLYKYYPPSKYSLDALMNEYFRFSQRASLNDPFDMNVQIIEVFPKLKEKIVEIYENDIRKYYTEIESFGVCCFTTSLYNKHFWALYANSYTGWCLEFEDTEELTLNPLELMDVVYGNEYPNFNDFESRFLSVKDSAGGEKKYNLNELLRDVRNFEKFAKYLLCFKEEEIWGNENEKRLIMGRNKFGLKSKNGGYNVKWKSKILKRIIIGHNISSCYKSLILKIANKKGVDLYQTRPNLGSRNFELEIVKINL